MFFTVPIYLHFLGVFFYGLFTVTNALIVVTCVITSSLSQATTKYVAEAAAKQSKEQVTRVVCAMFVLCCAFSALGTLVFWFGANEIAPRLVDRQPINTDYVISILRLAAVGILPNALISMIVGVFEGLQQFRASQILMIVRAIVTPALCITLLLMDMGLMGLIGGSVVVVWGVSITGLVLLVGRLRYIPFSELQIVATTKRIISFGSYTTMTFFGSVVLGSLDKLLVGALVNTEAVSYYAVAQNAANKLYVLGLSVARNLMPFFSGRNARDGLRGVAAPFVNAWRVSLAISLGLVTLAIVTAPWFLVLWLGASVAEFVLAPYLVFLVVYGLYAIHIVPHYLLVGLGEPKKVAIPVVISATIFLGLIPLVAPKLGIVGVTVCAAVMPIGLFKVCNAAWQAVREATPNLRHLSSGSMLLIANHIVAGIMGFAAGWFVWNTLQSNLIAFLAAGSCGAIAMQFAYLLFRNGTNEYYRVIHGTLAKILESRQAPVHTSNQ